MTEWRGIEAEADVLLAKLIAEGPDPGHCVDVEAFARRCVAHGVREALKQYQCTRHGQQNCHVCARLDCCDFTGSLAGAIERGEVDV